MDEYRKYEPIFGSWYLSRLIGKGSFGKVFEITREEFGTTYRAALKVISVPQDEDDIKARLSAGTDMDSLSEYYEGILREIVNENEIMSMLKGNSHIVSYEDHQIIPREDGIGYDILIRMELLTPLLDRMLEKKLDRKDVVKLGIDICRALETCHRKNIIHRDIKPQNIFISDTGDYKLGDFGIARTMEKTTGGMSKKGTYKYMAPEVFKGERYDSTVDIYSLGIVLYTLLNGNRGPFLPPPPAKVTHNDEEEARLRRFRGEPIPEPQDADPVLTYIIQKACANDPRDRYRTANQMRRDLEGYLDNYVDQTEETVALPAGEETVSMGSFSMQPDAGRYEQPREAAPPKRISMPDWSPKLIAAAAVAVVLILAGVIILITAGPGAEEEGVVESPPVETADTAGVTVLSSDWDWDSSVQDKSSGLFKVDAIFWVRNDSANAITGIEYTVASETGNPVENALEPGQPFKAYGYIGSGQSGMMVGEVWNAARDVKPVEGTYNISEVYVNNDLTGYSVPAGKIVNFDSAADSYDIVLNNPNSTEANANSKLVIIAVEDNRIMDSDATGHLSAAIPANTTGFLQKAAFVNPHLYTAYEKMTAYAIDVDAYGIAK